MTNLNYQNSNEHLLAELTRIEAIVRLHIRAAQQLRINSELQAVAEIWSVKQIEDLLEKEFGLPDWATAKAGIQAQQAKEIFSLQREVIAQAVQNSLAQGIELRLVELKNRFDLSWLEVDILLFYVAGELDTRFHEFYSYLQNDLPKRRPSINLILNLLSNKVTDKWHLKQYFSPDNKLFTHSLLRPVIGDTKYDGSTLDVMLAIDERILNYLLGYDMLDVNLQGIVSCILPVTTFADLYWPVVLQKR